MPEVFRMLLAAGFGLALTLLAGPAFAQWEMAERTSGNGEPAYMLFTELDADHIFALWCRGASHQIQLIDRDGRGPSVYPNVDIDYVHLAVANDVGGKWSSPGDFGSNTDGSLTLYYRNTEDLRAIADGIAAAKSEITVAMVHAVEGQATAFATTAKGSTAAARAFIDKCFGDAPAPQPALSLSAWEITIEPDPVNGGQQATLLADLDQGGYFHAFCDGRGRTEVAFLSSNPSTFPYEVGDVGLTLRVEIDGEQRSAVGEYFARDDGKVGIRYAAPEYLESLLAAVGAARSEVAITIESYSTGMVTRWPAKNLQGVGKAVTDFNAQCFGTAPTAPPATPSVADTPPVPQTGSQSVTGDDLPIAGWMADSGATTATLSGKLDNEHVLALNCGPDVSIQLIHFDGAETLPRDDLALSLGLSVDGVERLVPLPARVVRLAPGYLGFHAVPPGNGFWEILVALFEATSRIDVSLRDDQTGQILEWGASAQGIATPAFQFYTDCLTRVFGTDGTNVR